MREKVSRITCIILVITAVVMSYFVEQFLQPGYLVKSIIKVCSFGGIIVLFSFLSKRKVLDVIGLRKPKEKIWKLAAAIFLFFAGGVVLFLIFKNVIDWDGIRQTLTSREGLTKKNCIFAYTYIVVVNSFLEEAFFRGFIPELFTNKKAGYVISAVLFSAYHVGIIGNWFNVPLFILCVVGLALAGGFLQLLNVKYNTLIADWMVHASGNVALNAIGCLIIFGVI